MAGQPFGSITAYLDRWSRVRVVRFYHFIGENHMHASAGHRALAIEEASDAVGLGEIKARLAHRLGDKAKVSTLEQDVHILGVADGSFILGGNPHGHRIAADHDEGDLRPAESLDRPMQSFPDLLNGSLGLHHNLP